MCKIHFVLTLCYINVLLSEASNVIPTCKENFFSNISTQEPIVDFSSFCNNKTCVPKCCGKDEMLMPKAISRYSLNLTSCVSRSIYGFEVNYTTLRIYNKPEDDTETKKHFEDFYWVRNRLNEKTECAGWLSTSNAKLLENGRMAFISEKKKCGSKEKWSEREPMHYCVDIAYSTKQKLFSTFFITRFEDGTDNNMRTLFSKIASLISAIFLIPVLLCYCVLPQLRNLSGMLLMAYVTTLFTFNLVKAIIGFFGSELPATGISVAYYFCTLSIFFWLSIMSFDIWWTFRGQRLKRRINRRGELVKFGWYSLVGWGVPLVIAVTAWILDEYRDALPDNIVTACFDDSMISNLSSIVYVYIPIAILTITNITLFLMTVYNIVLIKHKIDSFKESSSSMRNNQNRFRLYIKLSLVMGISWLVELFQLPFDNLPWREFILVNAYNLLIGVIVFIVFVLNKKMLRMLCKRFNLKCHYLDKKSYDPTSTRSAFTSSTNSTSKGIYNNQTEDSDMEMTENSVCLNPNPMK